MDAELPKSIEPRLLAARDEVLSDAELLNSGSEVPEIKQPLDAGFLDLPKQLLEEHANGQPQSLLGRIEPAAEAMREQIDRLVLLGIGGSYMGVRALYEALCHPYHNELTREEQDRLALDSQMKCQAATEAGRFVDEIVPVEIPRR